MPEQPLPPPIIADPEADAVPPKWWGGCVGCLLVLLSAAGTVTGGVLLVRAVMRLWQ